MRLYLFPGARQARGEVRHQVGVQRVQPRVPAAQRHQPRSHQVLPVPRWSADGGGAAAAAGHHRPQHPRAEALSRPLHAVAAAIPYC